MTRKEITEALKAMPPYYERTSEQQRIADELHCREMINSCLAYSQPWNFYDEKSKCFGMYAENYLQCLGEKRTLELFREQQEDFANATVYKDVYTDYEGVSYNNVVWGDE